MSTQANDEIRPVIVVIPGDVNPVTEKRISPDVTIDVNTIEYLQVCTVGARYGQQTRKGDLPVGQIYHRSELRTTVNALEQWLPLKTLRPRTKGDYDAQQKWGVASCPPNVAVAELDADGKLKNSFRPPAPVFNDETQEWDQPAETDTGPPAPNTPAGRAMAAAKALAKPKPKKKRAKKVADPEPDPEPDPEEEDDPESEEEEEEEGEEDWNDEDARPDPRKGLTPDQYWIKYKIPDKAQAQCGACGQVHRSKKLQWRCFDEDCAKPEA